MILGITGRAGSELSSKSDGGGINLSTMDGKGVIELSFALILRDDGGKDNRIFAPIRFLGQFGCTAGLQTKNLRSFLRF
jgi:hypothetical protein